MLELICNNKVKLNMPILVLAFAILGVMLAVSLAVEQIISQRN